MIENKYYYVFRIYSGVTRKKTLFKLESVRFKHKQGASDWMDFLQSLKENKKHKFFILRVCDNMILPTWEQDKLDKEIEELEKKYKFYKNGT